MNRAVYIVGIVLLVGLLVLAEVAREEPVDWRYSFIHDDTRPYGGAVAWRLLGGWFEVERATQPPFVRLRGLDGSEADAPTYFFLTRTFAPDAIEAERLYSYAAQGGTVFVASERIEGTFADTLGIGTRFSGRAPEDGFDDDDPAIRRWRFVRTDTTLHLATASAPPDGYALDAPVPVYRFNRLDYPGATVLGTTPDGRVNFARLPVGAGQVLLLATPTVFSNAVLLADDPDRTGTGEAAAYLAAALATLPDRPLVWDSYYKPGRDLSTSPLRYVFETSALRGAYLTALLGIVLFFLLRARRWQRPIPVVAPPPNAMATFAEHVGRLYHEQGDTQALAATQRRLLLERLRRRTHLDDLDLSEASAQRVAHRLGLPDDEVIAAFARLRRAETQPVSSADLLELDRRLHALTEA